MSSQVLLTDTPDAAQCKVPKESPLIQKKEDKHLQHIFVSSVGNVGSDLLTGFPAANRIVSIVSGGDDTHRHISSFVKKCNQHWWSRLSRRVYALLSLSVCLSVYPPCLPQLWGHSVQTVCGAVEQWRASLQSLFQAYRPDTNCSRLVFVHWAGQIKNDF